MNETIAKQTVNRSISPGGENKHHGDQRDRGPNSSGNGHHSDRKANHSK